MAFFNEFPHTRTYDSDLAWLIKRMKEVLSRMDSVEARMSEVERILNEFLQYADEELRRALQELIDNGTIAQVVYSMVNLPRAQILCSGTARAGGSEYTTLGNVVFDLYEDSCKLTMRFDVNERPQRYIAGFNIETIVGIRLYDEAYSNLNIPFSSFCDLFKTTCDVRGVGGGVCDTPFGTIGESGTFYSNNVFSVTIVMKPDPTSNGVKGRGSVSSVLALTGTQNILNITFDCNLYGANVPNNPYDKVLFPSNAEIKTLITP